MCACWATGPTSASATPAAICTSAPSASGRTWSLREPPATEECRLVGLGEFAGERLEVGAHDGQSDGGIEGVAVAGGGFQDEFPVTHAALVENPLPEQRAGQGQIVGERAVRVLRGMILRQEAPDAVVVGVAVVNATQDGTGGL